MVGVGAVHSARRHRGAACFAYPAGSYESSSNWGVFFSLSLLVYPTVGAFLAWRHPENLIGWLLCAIGFLFVMEGFAVVYAGYALSVEPDSLPGKQIALWGSGGFTSRWCSWGLR